MKRTSSTRRVIGTGVLTAVGLVATIGGVSYAAGSHGSTAAATTAAATAAKKADHRRSGLLGRAEYGQVVVRRHGHDVTLDVQRGVLTAVDVTGSATGSRRA